MEPGIKSYCPECSRGYSEASGFCPFHGKGLVSIPRLPLMTGQTIAGKYRLEAPASNVRGRLGISYRAFDLKNNETVLLKLFDPFISEDQLALGRLKRSFSLSVQHTSGAHIRPLEVGLDGGLLFRASQWVDGQNLHAHLAQHPPSSFREIRELLMPVLAALEESHALGQLHLGVKPCNIMVVKEEKGFRTRIGECSDNALLLSQDGVAFGPHGLAVSDPVFLAPEQIAGRATDIHSDVYLCGVLLLRLLNTQPFAGLCVRDIFKAKLKGDLSFIHRCRDDFSNYPRLEKILASSLASHPSKRISSITSFRTELELITRKEGSFIDAFLAPPKEESKAHISQHLLEAVRPPEEVPEDPVQAQSEGDLEAIWDELDRDAQALLKAQKKKTWLGVAAGAIILVAFLALFLGDIVMGARNLLRGGREDEGPLNEMAMQASGVRRQDDAPDFEQEDKKKLLERLAATPLGHLPGETASLGLEAELPLAGRVSAELDREKLARTLEGRAGSGRPTQAPGPSDSQPAPSATPQSQLQAPPTPPPPTSAADTPQKASPGPAPESGIRVRGSQQVAEAKVEPPPKAEPGKSGEALSRERMNKEDFELARMAIEFGNRNMKLGLYPLAIENFRNAKRMGWHPQTVDALIAKAEKMHKELEQSVAQGRSLMGQGRFAEAIKSFERAQALGDSSNTTNNLILEAREKLGR